MPRRSPTILLAHVVWATAGRRASITEARDPLLHSLVRDGARTLECAVVAMGNASDHVHVLVRYPARVALADLVQRMKGRSSFFGGFRWQAGYYAESIGLADVEGVAGYVARQRSHHDDSHPAEHWIRSRESAAGGLGE